MSRPCHQARQSESQYKAVDGHRVLWSTGRHVDEEALFSSGQ